MASEELRVSAGALPLVCPNCRERSSAKARFCWSCGVPLRPPLERTEIRKTVSIIFCDLAGSTALGERLEAEAMRAAVSAYFTAMREALEHHGGMVEKFIGDAVMAVFGVPELHEDDALRAVRAAHDMRLALDELNDDLERQWQVRLRVRIGVNTGEVVAGDPGQGQAFVTGDAVNVAARLEQAAQADEILISDSTHRLVRDAVRVEEVPRLEAKGKSEPLAAHRLVEVLPYAPALARRSDAAFVGREAEQRQLQEAFRAAVDGPRCALLLVVGNPGAGKTRLAEEFATGVGGEATVVRTRCLSYGAGLTFWTIGELIRELLELPDLESRDAVHARLLEFLPEDEHKATIVERVEQLLGLESSPADLEQTFWVTRRLLETAAARRPIVVLLEDLHWAQPTFLDLVEYLVASSRDVPVLLLALARPELLEERAGWAAGRATGATLHLEPLSDGEARALVHSLVGEVEDDLAADILARAGGNPLFLEELLRMLVDGGWVHRRDGRWTRGREMSSVHLAPTLEPLIASRLERLDPLERLVLERASVVGQVFWAAAVRRLLERGDDDTEVGAALESLWERGIVERGSRFAGEDAYSFANMLMREVAYKRVLKTERAVLHEALARWLSEQLGDRAEEYDEFLGYHLEQAAHHLTELGSNAAYGGTLATDASRHLAAAGRRALARGEVRAAANLLERALGLLPHDHPDRAGVSLRLGIALAETGELARADALLRERVETERSGVPFLMYRDAAGRHHVFDLQPRLRMVSFGRRPDNDVALEWDGQVSRVHAELTLGPEGWMLADKQSRNGSFVNGEPVERPHLLRDGDVVRLGDTILLYREPTSAEQVALADAHSGITVLGRQLMSP